MEVAAIAESPLERALRLVTRPPQSISDYSPKSSCGSALSPTWSEDSDTPKSRTGFGNGILSCSRLTTSYVRRPAVAG